MHHTRHDPSGLVSGPRFTAPPAEALALLLEAYACARELGRDRWEFAVEIQHLYNAGLSSTDLRWFLAKGYALQALERTRPTARRRTFMKVSNLRLVESACFVLTEAGDSYARALEINRQERSSVNGQEEKPTWDAAQRELRVGQVVVKRFNQPAPNQERILAAFQEEGWPPRIDDPLPPKKEQDGKRRLHSTIGNLNRGQKEHLIRFEGGGDGLSVRWRFTRSAESESRASTGRV